MSIDVIRLLSKLGFSEGSESGFEICAICLMEGIDKEKVIRLPCHPSHKFHEQCIKKWF